MKRRKFSIVVLMSILVIVVIGITMIHYVRYVQNSLWNQSTTDILQATSQEEKAFQIYLEKDQENLISILKDIASESDTDKEAFLKGTQQDNVVYVYINLKQNKCITGTGKDNMTADEIQKLKNIKTNTGVTKPYFNRVNGVKMIAIYAKSGDDVLIKENRVEYIAKQFSLSFYNNLGFSYITDDTGNILIRSSHQNANRTIQNLFDIIDLEGNDHQTVDSFKKSLANHQKGIALFNYHKDNNVFCYVPISNVNGWYFISVIPNHAIMDQANNIILLTIILSMIIIFSIGGVMLLYRYNNKKHENEVKHLAYYDSLTNLYNYQKFKIEAEKKLKDTTQKWAVLYIDIAGFKVINDLNGYQFGDQMLKVLAHILESYIAQQGVVCHMTADKFLILMSYSKKDDLIHMSQNIHNQFQTILKDHGMNKETVLKFGICCYEDTAVVNNVEGLIDRGHLALQEIEENSDAFYCFYNEAMHEQMMKDVEIESKMENALANHEFVFYLQPKYNLDGKQILGAEALVRWIEKDGHMIMPNDFIPLFERNGFVLKLDEFIFESVCQYIAKRLKKQLSVVPISINVSRLHLHQQDFVERYANMKEQYHIPDNLLELEITENILLDDIVNIQDVINGLKKHGFTCSIDDFGSGYSSLNSLKDLSFDVIKLDKLFLKSSCNIEKSQEIIKSIIHMAESIHIKTVAEGVETTEQLDFMKTTGCNMIQGYIFAKPMPVHEFEKII